MSTFFYSDAVERNFEILYEEEEVQVLYDPNDPDLVVHVQVLNSTGDWLDKDQALAVAHAILDKFGDKPVKADPTTANVTLLQVAAAHQAEVTFRYAKGESQSVIETRRFKPGKIEQLHGNLVVYGYDPDRDEPRAFRVDRIKGQVTVVGDA